MYLYGFGSSAASGTVKTLRELLPDFDVVAPDIPVDPIEALPFLRGLCMNEVPDVVVGTSVGGMYAQQMRGYNRICVNPAFEMSKKSKMHSWKMLLQSPIAYAAIVHSDYCQMAISRGIHLQVDCFLIKSSFYLHF